MTNMNVSDNHTFTDIDDNGAVEIVQRIHKVISCVFGLFFGTVGIPGNLISCYVWRSRKMTSSTTFLMTMKSINDVIVCLLYITIEPLPLYLPEIVHSSSYGMYFSFVGLPLFSVFTYASNWMLAAVTTDRFLKLYRPFIQHRRTTKYTTYIGVFCLYFLCFLMAIPIFFKFQPNVDQVSINGEFTFSATSFSKSSGYAMWEIWVHCWFLMTLPLSVTVTVSFLIVRQIRHFEQNQGGKKNIKLQITRMILKTVTFFGIRIAVQCIGQCLLLAFVSDKRISHELVWVTKVGKIVNCSVNLLIYCKCNEHFRKTLINIFDTKRKVDILARTEEKTEDCTQTELITKI